MRFVLFRRNLLRARIVRRRPIKTQQGNSRQRGTSAVKTLQRCEGALWFHFLFQRYFPAMQDASLAAELFRVLRRARETAVQVRVALGRQQLRFTGRTRIIARDANSWKSSVAKLHMFR